MSGVASRELTERLESVLKDVANNPTPEKLARAQSSFLALQTRTLIEILRQLERIEDVVR